MIDFKRIWSLHDYRHELSHYELILNRNVRVHNASCAFSNSNLYKALFRYHLTNQNKIVIRDNYRRAPNSQSIT